MTQSTEFKSILVTGGAGYLGSQIIRDLAPLCQEIRILDNFTGNGNPLALTNLPRSKYRIFYGSMLDPIICKKATEGVSAVFHLAAITEIEYSKTHPQETKKVNVEGTRNLIKAAEENKVDKFVFPSSAAMYGLTGHFNEENELKPAEPYSESKKECEELILNSNLNHLIFRQATIFGFSPNIRFNIIGQGQTYEGDRELAEKLEIKNINFIGRVPYEKLADWISNSDLCLGIFGETQKADIVIPNKIFEYIASGKPVITRSSSAINELFIDGENILLCEKANPEDLAKKILEVKNNPALAQLVARNGYETFKNNCAEFILGRQLLSKINGIL